MGITKRNRGIKLSDTINTMELIHADNLTPDQLMVDDLVNLGDGIVEIVNITSDGSGDVYTIQHRNEFDEIEFTDLLHNEVVKLYVFIDNDIE